MLESRLFTKPKYLENGQGYIQFVGSRNDEAYDIILSLGGSLIAKEKKMGTDRFIVHKCIKEKLELLKQEDLMNMNFYYRLDEILYLKMGNTAFKHIDVSSDEGKYYIEEFGY